MHQSPASARPRAEAAPAGAPQEKPAREAILVAAAMSAAATSRADAASATPEVPAAPEPAAPV
ncbi:hypothetical protein ACHAC9_22535, partial [Massilia sp. CMS3.1]